MPRTRRRGWLLAMAIVTGAGAIRAAAVGGEDAKPDAATSTVTNESPAAAQPYTVESLRGRLVWMAEALKRRYNIESDADAAESEIALETPDGKLVPLVKDFRSRGFWRDPRLRGIDAELEVRRFDKSPAVQIVRWFAIRQGRKYELDYWCDICAIPMYELKTCDCCQGEIRLRERLVDEQAP